MFCAALAVLGARGVQLQSQLDAATRKLCELADATWIEPGLREEHAAIYETLAHLDRELEWLGPADLALEAPWRWELEHRGELQRELATMTPMLDELAALLESPACRRWLAEPSPPGRATPRLGFSRNWQNLLCARAVASAETAERARWLSLSFDHARLRDDGSALPIGVCLLGISLQATQVVASDPTTDAALLRCELEECVSRGARPHDFRHQAAMGARYIVEQFGLSSSVPVRRALPSWTRPDDNPANVLEAASVYGKVFETGSVPGNQCWYLGASGFLYLTIDVHQRSRRRHELARIGLALAEFRQRMGHDPADLTELEAWSELPVPRDPLTGQPAELARGEDGTSISFPESDKWPLDVWRFAL